MLESLLATKLTAPRIRSNLVARPRLSERLAQARSQPLTLVCAPAGYGKTTLVAAWLLQGAAEPETAAGSAQVAWLSLDEADNDPVRFWVYVIAALQRIVAGLGEQTLALLRSPQPGPWPTVLTFLINDLAVGSEPLYLVLDDYHLIETPAIHDGLTFLVERLPARLHLVIISRVDPPLPLARMRVRGQLGEVREADLRFTVEEASEFLQQVCGLPLSAAEVAALESRTEGWVAGLQLAALALSDVSDQAGAVAAFSGSHRHLVDYLTGEILARQPETVQQFLLQTALLDRFCADLCQTVLADPPQSVAALQAQLTQLEQQNLFLVPLDEQRRWYRYHHLFADLLRFRASQVFETFVIRQVHRRAAVWFEAAGLWPEAVQQALAAEAFDTAGRIVGRQTGSMVVRGELATLSGWLAGLPQIQIEQNPQLCLAKAWVLLFEGKLETAEPWLQQAEAMATVEDRLQAEALAIRATLAFGRADAAQTIAISEQALALLPDDLSPLRSLLTWHLAFVYRSIGDVTRAVDVYSQTIVLSERNGNALVNLSARRELAEILIGQGDLWAAEAMLVRLIEDITTQGWTRLTALSGAYVHLGEIEYDWNALDKAVTHFKTAVDLPQAGEMSFDAYGYAVLAQSYAAQGDHPAAATAIRQAEERVRQATHPQRRALTLACITRFWLGQGDVARAAHWLPDGRQIPQDPHHEVYLRLGLVRARYLLATKNKNAALAIIDELWEPTQSSGRVRYLIELYLLRAQLSDRSAAKTYVGQALALAEPQGYLRLFLDEGEPLVALLAQLPPAPYRDRLLAAFSAAGTPRSSGAEEKISSPAPPLPHPAALIEPLSDRELEVLCLMAEGHSNREIAEKLVFTVATAKKHAENIYGKLGVHSRTQAIARARELNLL